MVGLPKSIHPDVREMDALRQRLDSQYNAYLNSATLQSRAINKPPAKEDVDRMMQLARTPPSKMNTISKSVYERNRNWVHFVMARYQEQLKTFEKTGFRHRLYTPEMLGKKAVTEAGKRGAVKASAGSAALEAQRRVNRRLHGLKDEDDIPDGAVTGEHSPMGASAPQQTGKPSPDGSQPAPGKRRVIVKRIIRRKADGTKEVVEERRVVEGAGTPSRPSAPAADRGSTSPKPARPLPKPAPKPVDKELDDFFKKYNLK